jgi:hypothetical protein
MRLEVDQSRKVEQSGSTVLAFSDDEHRALLVPNQVKRQVLRRLSVSSEANEPLIVG